MVNYTVTSGSPTFNSIFDDPFFIGFDALANRLTSAHTNSSGFPPYNVRKVNDDTFVVEIAVAGYNKYSIDITEHEGTLTVKGQRPEDAEEYIHKGIAGRKFTRSFALSEYMYVDSADLNDGMLYIVVKRDIPEEAKPKIIKIK